MWELVKPRKKGQHQVVTKCEYEEGHYKISIKRGEKKKYRTFKAKQEPKEGLCQAIGLHVP